MGSTFVAVRWLRLVPPSPPQPPPLRGGGFPSCPHALVPSLLSLLDRLLRRLAGPLCTLLHAVADVFHRLAGAVADILAELLEGMPRLLRAALRISTNGFARALEDIVLALGLLLLRAIRGTRQ